MRTSNPDLPSVSSRRATARSATPRHRLDDGLVATARFVLLAWITLCGNASSGLAANTPPAPPSTPAANAARALAAESPLYQIGPLDELRLIVFDHPELSTSVAVRPDGRISVPLIEDLPVAGKTPTEVARELEARYATYVKDTRVTVIVASPVGPFDQQIRIVGGAGAPTAIPYRSGMTVLDALTTVGGVNPFANGNRAVVVRRQDGVDREIPVRLDDIADKGDLASNIALQPGDTLLIPEGIWNGTFKLEKTLNFTTSYSDNYRLDPPGQQDPALFFTASPGLRVSGETARFQGAAAGQVNLNYRAISKPRVQPNVNLLAQGTGELARNEAYIDAAASVTPIASQAGEGQSAAAGNYSNQSMAQTYTVSPYVNKRLNEYVNAAARYRFGTYVNGDSNSSTTYYNQINAGLLSGEEFSRLQWQAGVTTSNSSQNGYSGGLNNTIAAVDATYGLTRQWSLVGSLGYQWFSGGSGSTDFSGVTWAAGFQYQPNPDATLQLTYGERDNDRNVQGEARYRIGPFTNFVATASEFTGLQQVGLINNLQFLTFDPTSQQFLDRRTGLQFSQVPSPSTIDNQITRQQNYQAFLTHQMDRNSFQLSGNISKQEALGYGNNSNRPNNANRDANGDEKIYGVSGGWSRPIAPKTSISLRASYSWIDQTGQFIDNNGNNRRSPNPGNFQNLEQFFAGATLSYQLMDNVRSFVSYGRVRQFADQPNNEYTENAVTLGLSSSF